MDPALHVTRAHGQHCVYSARGVGTVCARCVTEVILGRTAPLEAWGASAGETQALVPSHLATTRARFARALAGLARDSVAAPDVAHAWGHPLVAACADALAHGEDDAEVVSLLRECAVALCAAAAPLDGGELLDAAVDRAVMHLTHLADPRHPGIPPAPPRVPSHLRLPPAPAPESQGEPTPLSLPPPGALGSQSQDWCGLGHSQSTAFSQGSGHGGYSQRRDHGRESHPPPFASTRGGFPQGGFHPSSHHHPALAAPQPPAPPTDPRRDDLPRARTLHLLADLLKIDTPRGDLPAAFRIPAPAREPPAATRGAGFFASQSQPEEATFAARDPPFGFAPGSTSPTSLGTLGTLGTHHSSPFSGVWAIVDALGRGRGGSPPSTETRRAGVAAAAALLREPTRAVDALRRAGATRALVMGALASTVSIGVADAETHETTLRIVATTATLDPEGANLAGFLADRGDAVAGDAARAPFLRATFDALLSSRATVRIAACACIAAVVNRRDPAAAARLVDAGVAEHLYETLRDRVPAPARETVRVPLGYANRHDQTRRDGADRSETTFAALRCLRAVAEACPPGAFARRFASGVDPTATTLRDAVDSDDARVQTAAAAFVRRAAEDIDPGNVPPDAAVRLLMLLADVYERAPATVQMHTQPRNDGDVDSDDPRAEARGALAALLRWDSLGDDTRARVGRKTFGTMAADLARDLRALVDDRASPATRDAPSSEIPRFMREVLERHARPAESSSVADVLRAHDVPGLLVASLRRVDALTRADHTAERNAVECICATAAVLGVVLGDDDGDDDGDGGVGDEHRPETRWRGGLSIPGEEVSDAVRAERDDARDVRRELAEGLMRADAVGATLWALSALLDRHRASSWSSPPPAERHLGRPEAVRPDPDPDPDPDLVLDLEPSGVLWSFLAVVLGALGPDVVPRTIREEMHRPRRWPTGPEWSPAGVFAAFAAAPSPGESPGDRRDEDVAGNILVACLFARIAREPTRDGSYSATGLTDGDGLLRECAGYFLDHLARRAAAAPAGEDFSDPFGGFSRRDLGDGDAAVLSLVVWNECVRLGAPVDATIERYLMTHYARAFGGLASSGDPSGEGAASVVALAKSGSVAAAARAWDRVSRAGSRRPGSATWRANARFLIAVLSPPRGFARGRTREHDGGASPTAPERRVVAPADFRRFEEVFADDVALATLAQTLCREGDEHRRDDARVAREALVRCMNARAPPSRAAAAVRGETWRECARAAEAGTLDPRSPVLDDVFAVAAAATTLNAHLRRTRRDDEGARRQNPNPILERVPSTPTSTVGFYGEDPGLAASRFVRACRRGVGVERRTAVVAVLFDDLIAEALCVDAARGDEPPARTFRVQLAREAMRTARGRRGGADGDGSSTEPGADAEPAERSNALTVAGLVVASEAILDARATGDGARVDLVRVTHPRSISSFIEDVPFLCDVAAGSTRAGLGAVCSLDRASSFDVLATVVETAFDLLDSERLARIRRVARAGTCAGETETEREAAAGCLRAVLAATPARENPEEDDETLWDVGVVEDWVVGAVPGIEATGTGTNPGETDARLALLATVARRVPAAFARAFGSRDAATRAAAAAAAAMGNGADAIRPGAVDALRALFGNITRSGAEEGADEGANIGADVGADVGAEVGRRPAVVASAMAPEDLAGVREVVESRLRELASPTRRRPVEVLPAALARDDKGETRATGLWSTVARVGYDLRGELTALTREIEAVTGRIDRRG